MTKAKRENPRRFIPVKGKIYENAGGGRYLCLEAACGEEGPSLLMNIASGWTLLAHGIVRYQDGTIEWDYSTGGHFSDPPQPAGLESFLRTRSMMNAMLCCMI